MIINKQQTQAGQQREAPSRTEIRYQELKHRLKVETAVKEGARNVICSCLDKKVSSIASAHITIAFYPISLRTRFANQLNIQPRPDPLLSYPNLPPVLVDGYSCRIAIRRMFALDEVECPRIVAGQERSTGQSRRIQSENRPDQEGNRIAGDRNRSELVEHQ